MHHIVVEIDSLQLNILQINTPSSSFNDHDDWVSCDTLDLNSPKRQPLILSGRMFIENIRLN